MHFFSSLAMHKLEWASSGSQVVAGKTLSLELCGCEESFSLHSKMGRNRGIEPMSSTIWLWSRGALSCLESRWQGKEAVRKKGHTEGCREASHKKILTILLIKGVVVRMTICYSKHVFAISTNGQWALMMSTCYYSVWNKHTPSRNVSLIKRAMGQTSHLYFYFIALRWRYHWERELISYFACAFYLWLQRQCSLGVFLISSCSHLTQN